MDSHAAGEATEGTHPDMIEHTLDALSARVAWSWREAHAIIAGDWPWPTTGTPAGVLAAAVAYRAALARARSAHDGRYRGADPDVRDTYQAAMAARNVAGAWLARTPGGNPLRRALDVESLARFAANHGHAPTGDHVTGSAGDARRELLYALEWALRRHNAAGMRATTLRNTTRPDPRGR